MSARYGLIGILRKETFTAPRDISLTENARNPNANAFILNMQNRNSIGLDWAVMNNDSTAGNYARVLVDGVEFQVPNQSIEAHTNEPFNIIEVYGPSTNVNIRVAGVSISKAKELGLI